MIVLGIETSCDETAAAVVEDGHHVLSNVVASQISQHSAFGGVVPELAAREHTRAITCIVNNALDQASLDHSRLDGISVTYTPGLLPALLVGISYAKGLSAALDIPLKGINHFLAHIFGAFIDREDSLNQSQRFPFIALVVSGGHTALILVDKGGHCRIVGRTLDDAAGEAFDKAAKILDLCYPGGPVIDKLSRKGDEKKYSFPRGLTGGNGASIPPENRLNFSFSGVKTALLYHVKEHRIITCTDQHWQTNSVHNRPRTGEEHTAVNSNQEFWDTVASYQEAIVDALVKKSIWAVKDYHARTLVLCGGVACNSRLRHKLQMAADKHCTPLVIAQPQYCTDNAAMIAGLAYYHFKAGEHDPLTLDAKPRLENITSVPFV